MLLPHEKLLRWVRRSSNRIRRERKREPCQPVVCARPPRASAVGGFSPWHRPCVASARGASAMPDATRPVHHLPISHVRVEGRGMCLDEQRVYCQRKSRTVSVGECGECRHFHALRPGVRDALACLICDEAPPAAELPSHFHLPRLCAGDLMTRDVVCVRPDLSLDAAALLMLEQPGQTLPVVDASGVVIGTLSDSELQLEVQAARGESGTVMAAMTPCPLL